MPAEHLTTAGPVEAASAPAPIVNLGARLRRVREASGMSLREAARQLGVSPSFVSQLETGKSQPSVATLYALSQLFDVSLDTLFAPRGDVGAVLAGGDEPASSGAADPEVRDVPGPQADDIAAGPAEADALRPVADPVAVESTPGYRDGVTSIKDALTRSAGDWSGEPVARLSVTDPGRRPRLVMDSGVIWEQLAANTGPGIDFIRVTYPPGSSSTENDLMMRHVGFEYGYLLEGELEMTVGFDTRALTAGQAFGLDSTVPHRYTNRAAAPAVGVWFVHHPRPE